MKETMTTPRQPFTLELTASATVRTVIYADNLEDAYEALADRQDELLHALQTTAGIPSNKYVLVDSDANESLAVEMDPDFDEYIQPGSYKFDACDHPDHEHE